MSSATVYVKIEQNIEVHERDVTLGQLGEIRSDDKAVENQVKSLKLMTVHAEKFNRYVFSIMDVVKVIQGLDPKITVTNMGETDFIVDYQKPKKHSKAIDWGKTVFVCLITFIGSAFAIMTFNNDGDVSKLFTEFYMLIMGVESDGFTIIEAAYSIGLPLGIILFFNHFSKKAFSTDPTPMEVQMRIYEEEVDKALIKDAGRKESGIDVH